MANNSTSQIKGKNKAITLILALFFGYFGFHRFYVGKKASGWVWLFTCGLFGIGWFIDIILILTDKFTNEQINNSSSKMKVDYTFMEIEQDFHTKVVGVTFKNSDGSKRQDIIKKCKVGDDIIFKPVPTKEYPDAIGVFTTTGKQLGHVNADLALELKEKYPMNFMKVTIANITGGVNGENYGCNLYVIIYKKQ